MKYFLILLAVLMTANPVFAGDSCRTLIIEGDEMSYADAEEWVMFTDADTKQVIKFFANNGWYQTIPHIYKNFLILSDNDLDELRILFDCIAKKHNLYPTTGKDNVKNSSFDFKDNFEKQKK